jgi:predicted small secreted protein
MSLKKIIIGLIIVVAILFGVRKVLETFKGTREAPTSVIKESIRLKTEARGLVEKSREQVKDREQMLERD